MNWYSDLFFESLRSKNEWSFAKLYEDTVDRFYRYIKSNSMLDDNEAQDILSETYIKIRNSLEKLTNPATLSSYLWTIMKNTLKDHFKKHKEVSFSEMDGSCYEDDNGFEENIEDDHDIKDLIETSFQSERILQALDSLEDSYKDVIFFKFVEWRSNHEIATYLDIQEDNVRQRLSRWLGKLKAHLGV